MIGFLFTVLAGGRSSLLAQVAVQLYETNRLIPTYLAAPPDVNPRFYSGRTYQGARATFYPYPVSDRLTDVRQDKSYQEVVIENRYIRLTVLPELGGRIFTAADKGNNYDFFYQQHVIKPALIGMLGAWISGGVEWNVPHHHRASSFMPVDYTLQENPDGSKTLWVGETELRHRMKWIVGLTLYLDRSYIEMTVKLFNRTPFAHSFLFWINPAVHANENYQVIFPPSTEFGVQHGKPEFVRWPIARSTYAGVDYSSGVDISWWKSHPSPCSFFAWNSEEDFFGGYDHGKQAGVIHWANHHVVPGKKFFEWGTGPEGQMWSKILTDADGPYLELMAGAYSDNQPDYSWCQPGEVKTWKHYWYPIRQIGTVKAATLDAAVNLEVTNRVVRVAFNATSESVNAQARLEAGDKVLLGKVINIGPATPFATTIPLPDGVKEDELRVSLRSDDGRELVAYKPVPRKEPPMPEPVKRPAPPKECKDNEELYLTGLRIEQLYSPSFEAAPYYEEAIRRDPGDYRANTALGILLCKAWRWSEAEARLAAAVARATQNYIRPKDGEAFYYLGVALRAQGKLEAAYGAFYKSIWCQGWQGPGYQALAELDCLKGDFDSAVDHIDRSLGAGAFNTKARNLKAAILRRQSRPEHAEQLAKGVMPLDPLDFGAANELCLAQRLKGETDRAGETIAWLLHTTRTNEQTALESAVDYGNSGFWSEAIEVLRRHVDASPDKQRVHPMVCYCLAYYADKAGLASEASRFARLAAQASPDYCFPLRWEEEAVLRHAMRKNPQDARAPYYLGNLLFDNQPAKAIEAWEQARQKDPSFPLVHRNLALAYTQAQNDIPKAISSMERAVSLNAKDPRWLYELDVLHEAGGTPLPRRLELLSRNHEVAAQRDDAYTREVLVLIASGNADRAIDLLRGRRFHNWEGRGEIHNIYAEALLRRGVALLAAKKPAEALKDFEAALDYPANLEVGRPHRDRKAAQIYCSVGLAHEALGDTSKARTAFEQAVQRKDSSPSEIQYYQGLAFQKLGKPDDARRIFDGLVRQGEKDLRAADEVDYFAKFGEKQTERARKAQAHFLCGLGYAGLGQATKARAEFAKAIEQNPGHLGANRELATIR